MMKKWEKCIFWVIGIIGIACIVMTATSSQAFRSSAPTKVVNYFGWKQPEAIKTTRRRPAAVDSAGLQDRWLNKQQSDELYEQLRKISDNPQNSDYLSVWVVSAFPQDKESSNFAALLAKIFTDAHWKVVQTYQPPIKIQGSQQPIGIWIYGPPAPHGLAELVSYDLKYAGVENETVPNAVIPPDFKGLVIYVGYKDAGIHR